MMNNSRYALAIAISALAGIGLFWAVILSIVLAAGGSSLVVAASAPSRSESAFVGFVGVAVGWFATHMFTIARDRRNRRGAFAGYLLQWRSNLARVSPDDAALVWKEYINGVHAYHLELGKIIEDYRTDEEFMAESDRLGNFQEKLILSQKTRAVDLVCTPLDKLRNIVRAKWDGPTRQ